MKRILFFAIVAYAVIGAWYSSKTAQGSNAVDYVKNFLFWPKQLL
jgi:hypothetical protein